MVIYGHIWSYMTIYDQFHEFYILYIVGTTMLPVVGNLTSKKFVIQGPSGGSNAAMVVGNDN
jgi:hypothetical protein